MGLAALLSTATIAFAGDASAAPGTPPETVASLTAQPMPGGSMSTLDTARQYEKELRALPGPQFEQAFLAGMIPHHAAAVAMAQLELARGTHPELKAMAQQIISGQSQEITEMTNWLHDWYGLTPAQAQAREPAGMQALTTKMANAMTAMTTQLAAVPAGPAFDEAFLTAMIPHHEMAIIVSRPVPARAIHPALRSLGKQIITTQSAEVRQMSTWLRTWYGVTS
jgi:uncharacterized protein (DUF305 family)